ncbi:MAG: hypothetical protein ACOCZQ_00670 [Nanoarchaeota archaeon]
MDEKKHDEIYEKYKKKYDLPEYKETINYLEVSCFDENELVLITLKKRILEKISKYMEILDPVVQPDTTAISLYENSFFTEEDRQVCFDIYKRLMILLKQADLVSLSEKDKENADFINLFFSEFNEIKPRLQKIISKQKKCWEKNTGVNDKVLNYFG